MSLREFKTTDQLIDLIKVRAPKLSPSIVPDIDAELFNAKQLKQLQKLSQENTSCTYCQAQIEPEVRDDVDEHVEWTLDLKQHTCSLTNIIFPCSACALVKDVTYVIPAATQDSSATNVEALAQHFLKVNGHAATSLDTFQDVYSLAYNLYILTRSGTWKLTANNGTPWGSESILPSVLSFELNTKQAKSKKKSTKSKSKKTPAKRTRNAVETAGAATPNTSNKTTKKKSKSSKKT